MNYKQHGMLQNEQKMIFQCNMPTYQYLCKFRSSIQQLCNQYPNRIVRVQTLPGSVFEGCLSHCNQSVLYLHPTNRNEPCASQQPHQDYADTSYRGPYGSYSANAENGLLPLILFDLLSITLM